MSHAGKPVGTRGPVSYQSLPAEIHMSIARRLDGGALLALRSALGTLPGRDGGTTAPRPSNMPAASVYDSEAIIRRDVADSIRGRSLDSAVERFHRDFVPRERLSSTGSPPPSVAPAGGGMTPDVAAIVIAQLAGAPGFAALPGTSVREINMLTDAVEHLPPRRRGAPLTAIADSLADDRRRAPAWPYIERLLQLAADMPSSDTRGVTLAALMRVLPRIAGSTRGDCWNGLANRVRDLGPAHRPAPWRELLLSAMDPSQSSENNARWPLLHARVTPENVPANLSHLAGIAQDELALNLRNLVVPFDTEAPPWMPREPQLQALFERVARRLLDQARQLQAAPDGAHAEFPQLPVGASWAMVENSPDFEALLRHMVADMTFVALVEAFAEHLDSGILSQRLAALKQLCHATGGVDAAWLDQQTLERMAPHLTLQRLPAMVALLTDVHSEPPPGTIGALSGILARKGESTSDVDALATSITLLLEQVGRVRSPAERQVALATLARAAVSTAGTSAADLWERLAHETRHGLPPDQRPAVWAPLLRLALPSSRRDPAASLPATLRPWVAALQLPPLDVLAELGAEQMALRIRPVVRYAIDAMDQALPMPGLASMTEPVIAHVMASVLGFDPSAMPGRPGPPQTTQHLVDATIQGLGSAPLWMQSQQRVSRLLGEIAGNPTPSRDRWVTRHAHELRELPSILMSARVFEEMLDLASRLPAPQQAGIYRTLDRAIAVSGPLPFVRDMRDALFRSIDREGDPKTRDARLVAVAARVAQMPAELRVDNLAMLLDRGLAMGHMAGQDMVRAMALGPLQDPSDAARRALRPSSLAAFQADLASALARSEGHGIATRFALARSALHVHPVALSRWMAATVQAMQMLGDVSSAHREVLPALASTLHLLVREPEALRRALAQLLHAPEAARATGRFDSIALQVVRLLGEATRGPDPEATSRAVVAEVVQATGQMRDDDRLQRLAAFAGAVHRAKDLPEAAQRAVLGQLYDAVAQSFNDHAAAEFFRRSAG